MSEHHLGEDLAEYAGSSPGLDAARRAALDQHVAGCEACQRAVAESRQIFSALSGATALEPSPGFDRALFARLDALDAPPLWTRVRDFFTLPRLAIGGGLAAAAIVAAVVLLPSPGAGPKVEPEVAVALSEPPELLENLEVLKDLEVIEDLDVADDLDVIEGMEDEAG